MNILKALKSSEIADNMTNAFVSEPSIQRYPFFPNIEQITPNTQNYPLIGTRTYTVSTSSIIRDKIPKNYYLRGILINMSAVVNVAFTGTGRTAAYEPFNVESFGFYKLIKYIRILQHNKEVKRIDFNNILDIITSKYDSFTADTIFNIASNSENFAVKADGSNTTLTATLFIPFSFSQMSKLCPDTTLLAPLELEIAIGNDFDSSSIYTTRYYQTSANYDTITVSSLDITPKYQFSSVEDVFYDQLNKSLYEGKLPRQNLDYGYITYKFNSVVGDGSSQETNIKLELGKLVKRYYIRAFLKNTDTNGELTDTEFKDGSDKITNIKLCSGSSVCFEYTKNESQLVSIFLGNTYRQSSANSIFGGYTLDMTNGFLQEKNNDYSSGFPEYFIEDPQINITCNPPNDTTLFIYITAEYYEVQKIDPANGLIELISDK